MKGPSGKPIDGIYNNPFFVHSAIVLVGQVVQLQLAKGGLYEGVFRTFSPKLEFVLNMVHKVDKKPSNSNSLVATEVKGEEIMDTMIFPYHEVVSVSASNVDLDYATRDTFTDTAISKFNGQVLEKELEPWDGGSGNLNTDSVGELGNEDVSNGWDADDMFKTNEEKYGVKSSFDSNLPGYTIPLSKQNTEEYKQQEAKASKIAQEIESGFHYKNRIALENGDEEERFSAVVRPDAGSANNGNGNRFITHRTKKTQGPRPMRSSPPQTYPGNRFPHPQTYHKVTSPNSVGNTTQPKMVNSRAIPCNIPPPVSRQNSSPLPPCQPPTPPNVPNVQQTSPAAAPPQQSHQPAPLQYQPLPSRNLQPTPPAPANIPSPQAVENRKINGEPPKPVKEPMKDVNSNNNNAEMSKPIDRMARDAMERKPVVKKVHDDKTEDLKRFHEKFKLPEAKEKRESQTPKLPEAKEPEAPVEPKVVPEQKPIDEPPQPPPPPPPQAELESPDETKNSSLNPNAKEFVLNPNAKSFTPRGVPMPANVPLPTPQPPVPPPRLHAQSPVIAMPQPPLMPGVPHPVFASHYIVPAPPVSVPPSYTPASSMAQAPRYRKAVPMTLPRNDSSQSIHVQAATGQPILAPPTISGHQFVQYTPASPAGILHPPPQQLTYGQMYQMPRVITPQQIGMVPAAGGTYSESPHVPTQIYMNPQALGTVQHTAPPSNSGQHSAPSTPQSQTPGLHTAPSPVHQPPPQTPHGQPPTPTCHPSNPPTPHLFYHSQIAQHPIHISAAAAAAHQHGHPYPTIYGAGPQPIMLLHQQALHGPHGPHPATLQAVQNHFQAQAQGAHSGTPTQIMPHPQVAVMPTSTALGHAQALVTNNHYVPHSQV